MKALVTGFLPPARRLSRLVEFQRGLQHATSSRLVETRRCLHATAPRPMDDDSHTEGLHRSPVTDMLWTQRMRERDMFEAHGVDLGTLPAQQELQTKAPRDSAVRVELPFSQDAPLRDRYTNNWGAVNKGIVFEDLDALAGNVAWRHAVMGNGTDVRPPMLVTAAVDEVRLRGTLRPDSDLYMTGRVIFVGSSSMLVRCEVGHVRPQGDGSSAATAVDEEALLIADFLYVARDRVTQRASPVNRLVCGPGAASSSSSSSSPSSPSSSDLSSAAVAAAVVEEDARDAALFAEKSAAADAQKRARQMDAASQLALDRAVKGEAVALLKESQALLRMPCLAASHRNGRSEVLIEQTRLQNTMICQPQQRNTSGRIFGGFLMRRAYELAVATAYCFSGAAPQFLWSDEISFKAPVSIGDVLRLDAHVLATEPDRGKPRIHCEVFASVLRPEEGQSTLSNRFAFTFCLNDGVREGGAVPAVRPSLTGEAIKQIEILKASSEVPDWDH